MSASRTDPRLRVRLNRPANFRRVVGPRLPIFSDYIAIWSIACLHPPQQLNPYSKQLSVESGWSRSVHVAGHGSILDAITGLLFLSELISVRFGSLADI